MMEMLADAGKCATKVGILEINCFFNDYLLLDEKNQLEN